MNKLTISIVLATFFLGATQSCQKEKIVSNQAKPKVENVDNSNAVSVKEPSTDQKEASKPVTQTSNSIRPVKTDFIVSKFTTVPSNKSMFIGLQITETRQLDGVFQGAPYSMLVASLSNGDFAYDIDKDGIFDYGLHPSTSDYSQVTIVDDINSLIGNASLVYKPNLSFESSTFTNGTGAGTVDATNSTLSNAKIAQVTFNRIIEKSLTQTSDILAAQKPTARSCFESTCGSAEGLAGAVVANLFGPWTAAAYFAGIWARCAYKY